MTGFFVGGDGRGAQMAHLLYCFSIVFQTDRATPFCNKPYVS